MKPPFAISTLTEVSFRALRFVHRRSSERSGRGSSGAEGSSALGSSGAGLVSRGES